MQVIEKIFELPKFTQNKNNQMNITQCQVIECGMPLLRGVVKAKSAVPSILYSTVTLTFDPKM